MKALFSRAYSLSVSFCTFATQTPSTDGAGSIPNEYLGQLRDVVVAYDNDEPGQLMSKKVMAQLPDAVSKTPKAVDWNEELVNQFNWLKESRSREIKQEPQQKQEQDGGLSL